MAKNDSDIFGIKDFKMGAPGDGIAGVVLDSFPDIKEASATLSIPVAEIVRLYSETRRDAPYKAFNSGNTAGVMIKLQFLGLTIEDWPKFFGGSVTTGVYTPPTTPVDIYQTIELTTKDTNAAGNYLKFVFPFALVSGGIDSAMTFNDLTPIDVTFEALIPISALGVEGAPWTVELV